MSDTMKIYAIGTYWDPHDGGPSMFIPFEYYFTRERAEEEVDKVNRVLCAPVLFEPEDEDEEDEDAQDEAVYVQEMTVQN